MDECDLENIDIDRRTDLEFHLYSAIHHNNSGIADDIVLSEQSQAQNNSEMSVFGEKCHRIDAMYMDIETSASCDVSNIDVISIISSDNEDDDIIEIEQAPPPLICIETDESDIECTRKESSNYHNAAQINCQLPDRNLPLEQLSKCASPASATSDDFIQHDCENLDRSEINEMSFRFNTHHPELDFSSSTQVSTYVPGSDTSSECSEVLANHDIFVHSDARNLSSVESAQIGNVAPESRSSENASDAFVSPQDCYVDTSFHTRDYNEQLDKQIKSSSRPKSITNSLKEMQKFYSNSWGGETFDHNLIISKMSCDKDKWKINNSDRQRHQRSWGWKSMRCHNCHQMGHTLMRCTEPKRVIKCYMCGIAGHAEPRCPNKICLRCGTPASSFLIGCHNCKQSANYRCPLCGMTGHNQYTCPDLWRRYHRSIDRTKIPVTGWKTLKLPQNLFCCNCSMRGHLYHNCRKLKFSEHGLLLPNIIEYSSVYPVDTEIGNENTTISSESNCKNTTTTQVKKKHKASSIKTSSKETSLNQSSFLASLNDFEALRSDDSCENIQSSTTDFNLDTEEKLQPYLTEQNISFMDKTKPIQNSIYQANNVMKQILSDDMQDNNVTSSEDEMSYHLMLDKETLAMLMKTEGTAFLERTSKMVNVQVKLQFSSTGGSLLLKGAKAQYRTFQIHLKNWIKQINSKLLNITPACNLPRKASILLNTLEAQISALRKSLGSPNVLYGTLKEIESNAVGIISEKQIKLYNRNLRKLNMHLFGKFGYRDGNMHMNELAVKIKELEILAKTIDSTPVDLYNEIKSHYDYIFSSMRHGDYEELLDKYRTQRFSTEQARLHQYGLRSQTPYTSLKRNPGKQIPQIPHMFPTPNIVNKSVTAQIEQNTNKSHKYLPNLSKSNLKPQLVTNNKFSEEYNELLKVGSHIIDNINCSKHLKKILRGRLKPFSNKRNLKQRDLCALQKLTKSLQDL